MTENLRIAVVGGGIVGIAIARALAMEHGAQVTVFEKETRLSSHQTGHNSGVVHAGLYYAPGSLKATLCASGRELTRDYCQEHNLPYNEVGKLVIASRPADIEALNKIEEKSLANRVPGLARITSANIKDIEPHAVGLAALHSPFTAVVDYAAITEKMADEVRKYGGEILLGNEVVSITDSLGRLEIRSLHTSRIVDRVIVCAGLQSDLIAQKVGADASPRILPFRGEYRALRPTKEFLVKGMIYPVPDPDFPFLGIHFTRGVYGDVHVGPNAVPALSREGYNWRQISMKDTLQSLFWPGAASLAKKHWAMGLKEIAASLVKPLYFNDARKFIPELRLNDLGPKTASGVRAQAWQRGGKLLDDFSIDTVGNVTLIRNAPSPAATSAMSIATYVITNHIITQGREKK